MVVAVVVAVVCIAKSDSYSPVKLRLFFVWYFIYNSTIYKSIIYHTRVYNVYMIYREYGIPYVCTNMHAHTDTAYYRPPRGNTWG